MYHYIKNGKHFASEEPIYYFEWVYGDSHVSFGMHGTEAEYAAKVEEEKRYGGIWADMRLKAKKPLLEVSS